MGRRPAEAPDPGGGLASREPSRPAGSFLSIAGRRCRGPTSWNCVIAMAGHPQARARALPRLWPQYALGKAELFRIPTARRIAAPGRLDPAARISLPVKSIRSSFPIYGGPGIALGPRHLSPPPGCPFPGPGGDHRAGGRPSRLGPFRQEGHGRHAPLPGEMGDRRLFRAPSPGCADSPSSTARASASPAAATAAMSPPWPW